ncbi:MAG TPA: N-acetylmuramoyl-L-alanine amidase [Desulfobulbus sp.]|nr:N-acetylmuramoyl-L-alanine amidase [Desulfobulbus sp.]
MSDAGNAKLKRVILQGVHEENKRLHEDGYGGVRAVRRWRRNRFVVRLSSVLLLAGLMVLTRFIVFPALYKGHDSIAPVEHAVSGPILPWSTVVMQSTNNARLKWTPVDINPHELLNYSLLLNDEQVRVSSVFGLDVQTIVIDPGHGGKDPGAIGSLGTNEKDIVLDIGLRLRDALVQSGRYNVIMTRDRDVFIPLAERVKIANTNRADLFISLHVNAIPQKEYNVTETFYFGPPTDKYTLRLAEQENRGSEIQAGDFKNMIKKISDTMKEQESALLAASIQRSLFSNMRKHDSSVADNGIKIAPFVVLLGVDAPSVLVEISCITKRDEEANLQKTEYRKQITSFIKEGVTSYLGQRHLQIVEGEHNGRKNNKKSS